MASHYQVFNNWLFDGRKYSPIPRPKIDENKNVIIPDILKYNSPITHTYVISLFLRNEYLNSYLDKYFNNLSVRYLSREDILKFIKKCIIDFKIKKRDLVFYKYQKRKILYDRLRDKMPILKNDDISLLCDIVENSENKHSIYDSLNLEMPKKIKVKKAKKIKSKKINLQTFLKNYFVLTPMKKRSS